MPSPSTHGLLLMSWPTNLYHMARLEARTPCFQKEGGGMSPHAPVGQGVNHRAGLAQHQASRRVHPEHPVLLSRGPKVSPDKPWENEGEKQTLILDALKEGQLRILWPVKTVHCSWAGVRRRGNERQAPQKRTQPSKPAWAWELLPGLGGQPGVAEPAGKGG